MRENLPLGFDLRFEDLYRREGLVRLDGCFVDFLKRRNTELHNRLMAARAAPEQIASKAYSDLIVELAVELEDFIACLFPITREVEALRACHTALAPLYTAKRQFVQRRAAKKYGPDQAATFDGQALREQLEPLIGGELTELRFAERVDAIRRKGSAGTKAACCSSCRARSTRITSLRSRPKSSMAWRCSSSRLHIAARATVSR